MEPGIRVEVVWFDEDVLELRVEASNRRLAATTDLYEGHDFAATLSDALAGFPRSIGDTRELAMGTFAPGTAGGGVRLRFSCSDAAGHAAVRVHVRAPVEEHRPVADSAEFSLPIEAAAIDSFVASLRRLSVRVGSVAALPAAR